MRTVRNIVNTGRTIVCTIHQPSIDIFEAFDELLLLKRGGELIFNGQLGNKSKHLVKYFSVSRQHFVSPSFFHSVIQLPDYLYTYFLLQIIPDPCPPCTHSAVASSCDVVYTCLLLNV